MRWLLQGALLLLTCGCGAQAVTQETQPRTPKSASLEAKPPPNTFDEKPLTAETAPPAAAADEQVRQPATVAAATNVLDLSTHPVMPGAKDPGRRVSASLGYDVASDVKTAFEFQQQTLKKLGWQELSPPQIYDQSASGEFGKAGYVVSVSVFPRGEPGQVSVRLQNHSHVNLKMLPVPPGAKLQYAFPATASFETTAGVDETAATVRKLLLDQGWHPYGSAADVMSFKQNAVHLDARVMAPPAQPGKTVITYSTLQMSVDLPAPPDAEHIRYADQLKQLNLHAVGSPDEVAAYYQKLLAPAGWESTTEKPVHNRLESFLIFRNPEKELLQLDMWDLHEEKKTRVTLRHQSAAEVDEIDRAIKLAVEQRKKKDEEERNRPKPKVAITLPARAQDVQAAANEIEFHVGSGQAQAALHAIVKELTTAGWQADKPVGAKEAGVLTLKKGDDQISIHYVDPGFIPAEITITAQGKFELQRTAAAKE